MVPMLMRVFHPYSGIVKSLCDIHHKPQIMFYQFIPGFLVLLAAQVFYHDCLTLRIQRCRQYIRSPI